MTTTTADVMTRADVIGFITRDRPLMLRIYVDGRAHLEEMDDELLADFIYRASDRVRDRGDEAVAEALAACASELAGAQ